MTEEVGARLQVREKDREFRNLLLESLDEVVREVLGERPLRAMYSSVEGSFHIKREEIPERLDDFQSVLADLFGASAAVITRAIVRRLCARLEIPYQQRSHDDFKTYVEDCRLRYKQKLMVAHAPETWRQRD